MPRFMTVISVFAAVLGALLGYTDQLPTFWAAVIIVSSGFTAALSKGLTEATDNYVWTILGIVGVAFAAGGTALQAFNTKYGLVALAISSALIAAGKALTPKATTLPMLLVAMLLSACGKEQIENTFAKTVVALRSARQVATVQHKYGHIDDAAYKSRLLGFDSAFDAVNATGDTIAGFGEITPGNKQQVLDQVNSLATTIDKLIADGDVGVKNPDSQRDYRRWLLLSKGIVNSIKIGVAAIDKPVLVKDLKIPKARAE